MNEQKIIALIRTHIADCEFAASRYEELESSPLHTLPLETIHRKLYAASAQLDRLQAILKEIEAGKRSHPDACHCDRCAAERYAFCGDDD